MVENTLPLRLAFRVRKGRSREVTVVGVEWRWWVLMPFVVQFEEGSGGGEYTPPPSRVSSKGGM